MALRNFWLFELAFAKCAHATSFAPRFLASATLLLPRQILHNFIRRVGISRNENLIKYELLEHCARRWLDENARRCMAVLEPLRVVITNVPEDYCEMREIPDFPKAPERGTHQVPFTRLLYIDRSDFRDVDEKVATSPLPPPRVCGNGLPV